MLTIKRAHDRNRTGWYALIILIPLAGPLWFLVEFGFLSGTAGPNRFGADPVSAPVAAPAPQS